MNTAQDNGIGNKTKRQCYIYWAFNYLKHKNIYDLNREKKSTFASARRSRKDIQFNEMLWIEIKEKNYK